MQKLFTREWFSQGLIKETIFFLFMLPNMVAANSMLAHPGSPEELYMGRTYITGMTRKDKMREGFVARTFHIPIGIDDELRMMAIKNCVRFSDMAIFSGDKRGPAKLDVLPSTSPIQASIQAQGYLFED